MSTTEAQLQKSFPDLYRKICWFGDELYVEKKEGFHRSREFFGHRCVFSNGCFDLFHSGHVALLLELEQLKLEISHAARKNVHLMIGLNSDSSARRIKGEGRPLVPEFDRAIVLASYPWVNSVVIFQEDTPQSLIDDFKPDYVVKGRGYQKTEIVSGESEPLILDSVVTGLSTTSLVQKL